jgi:hypothetical protein
MRKKPTPQRDQIEELPDAWERFEKAFDTVMKANPKPAPTKKSSPSQARAGKRGGSKSA